MKKIITLYCFCLAFCTNNSLKAQNEDDDCPCKRPYICGMTRSYIKRTDSTSFLLRGQTTLHKNRKPLVMIDGDVIEEWKEFRIDPNNVESVEILKSDAAAAIFGCEGMQHGAIIITTKNSKLRKFIIKDFLDGSRIAGATASFISSDQKDTLMFVADDSGVIVTDKLSSAANYTMTVSAVGYKSAEQIHENRYNYKEREVLLIREIKNCDEVILSSTFCPRKSIICGGWFYCTVSGINITADSVKKEKIYPAPAKLKVYPNPVQKGSILNFQFDNNDDKEKIVRVLSLNGMSLLEQALKTNKGKSVFQLTTDTRWAAGVYFVQLLYENGRVAASEKVIIQ
ncbi:MAG TPA: T9SS type A sorting domain-containing protein [Chitinophagaceae bacterium]|nr:T9SS type A sorting domain-containing protein [Chitinophagaceae bacterium]